MVQPVRVIWQASPEAIGWAAFPKDPPHSSRCKRGTLE